MSKARIKYMKSLQLKKHRDREGVFLVEGEKSVLEFINSKFKVQTVLGTDDFITNHRSLLEQKYVEFETITEDTLTSIGTYQSNNAALAIIVKPNPAEIAFEPDVYILALDNINDPGNLGTIIRLADWYGIRTILLSLNSTDVYNSKTVNASKGSLSRVEVQYVDLTAVLTDYQGTIYTALLDGENIHKVKFKKGGIVLMGSESHGVSEELLKITHHRITIPRVGETESLNVAMATAIICDNICRCNEII